MEIQLQNQETENPFAELNLSMKYCSALIRDLEKYPEDMETIAKIVFEIIRMIILILEIIIIVKYIIKIIAPQTPGIKPQLLIEGPKQK